MPNAPGELVWTRAALEPVVVAADEAGFQIPLHAIGDLTVRTGALAADYVVLDRNPFNAAPGELLDTRVVRTVVAGRTTYEA